MLVNFETAFSALFFCTFYGEIHNSDHAVMHMFQVLHTWNPAALLMTTQTAGGMFFVPGRSSLNMVFTASMSLPVFCLIAVFIIERDVLKTLISLQFCQPSYYVFWYFIVRYIYCVLVIAVSSPWVTILFSWKSFFVFNKTCVYFININLPILTLFWFLFV